MKSVVRANKSFLVFDLKIPLTEQSVAHLGEPARPDMVVFHSPADLQLLPGVPGRRNFGPILVRSGQYLTPAVGEDR